jgi:Tfp pilus assembly protein PilO
MMRRLQHLWPLAKQYPFLGICASLSVIFGIGAIGFSVRLHTLSVVQRQKQKEANAIEANLRSAPQLRQELDFVRQTMRKISGNLTKEESRIANQNYFHEMAEGCGIPLTVSPYNAPPPDTGADYIRIPFGLKATGTYSQLAAFIHAVETGQRISSITSFSFQKVAGSPVLTLNLGVDLLGKK